MSENIIPCICVGKKKLPRPAQIKRIGKYAAPRNGNNSKDTAKGHGRCEARFTQGSLLTINLPQWPRNFPHF